MSERYTPNDPGTDTWAYPGELDLSVSDEKIEAGLEHVSKSRIKTFLTCPRKFAYTYWSEVREDENYYTKRGSQVHEVFERFYRALSDYLNRHGERPDRFAELTRNRENWSQWIDYYGPFWEFEERRWQKALDFMNGVAWTAIDIWEPVAVEDTLRVEDPPVGDLPWMGPFDALLHSCSVPDDLVESDSGVTVVDFKTGSMKEKEAYRESGIYIDLEFYAWMLEENGYEVAAGIGFYPGEPGTVVREMPNPATRETIADVVGRLNAKPTAENYPIDEQPLCDYCHFQDQCPSNW